MQNLEEMMKTGTILCPENSGKFLKLSFVHFIEGSSDHLLLVYE